MADSSDTPRKVNILDVARRAASSPATVSRVLSGSAYPVSAPMRQRILDAARDLNYTPNAIGRMLKTNDTREIGVVVPTIANPFYAQLVLGLEREAKRRGYGMLLCNSLRDAADEERCLETLFAKQVLGVALSTVAADHARLRLLQRKGLRVVSIDQEANDLRGGRVGLDFLRGGMLAAAHLLSCGHRSCAYLSAPLTKRSRVEVLEGFRLEHALRGRPLDPRCVLVDEREEETEDGGYEFECGRRLARRLLALSPRPSALLAGNDLIAVGAMQELAAHGVSVPDGISVVGYDNILAARLVRPGLTTVDPQSTEIGRLACRTLLDMIEGGAAEVPSVKVDPVLVERGSVKRL